MRFVLLLNKIIYKCQLGQIDWFCYLGILIGFFLCDLPITDGEDGPSNFNSNFH